MSKTYLILFSLSLLAIKFGYAETISSSTNTGKEKDQFNTVTSHQQGAPAKVVKPSSNINPIVIVPVTPNARRPSTPSSK